MTVTQLDAQSAQLTRYGCLWPTDRGAGAQARRRGAARGVAAPPAHRDSSRSGAGCRHPGQEELTGVRDFETINPPLFRTSSLQRTLDAKDHVSKKKAHEAARWRKMDGRVVPVLRPTVERSALALRDMRRLRESCEDARRAVDGVLPFDYAALGFDDGGVDEQQLLEDNIAITDIALLSARDRLCWHKARLPAAPGRHPSIATRTSTA